MIYTALTRKAMQVANVAHHGQTDKTGVPYIFHPYHLAESMDDEETTCVALLHDVVEDTSFTVEQLAMWFPKEILEAIIAMTHVKDVDYFEYIGKIRNNPIARKVKLADLKHNMDTSRYDGLDYDQTKRDAQLVKYRKALQLLTNE